MMASWMISWLAVFLDKILTTVLFVSHPTIVSDWFEKFKSRNLFLAGTASVADLVAFLFSLATVFVFPFGRPIGIIFDGNFIAPTSVLEFCEQSWVEEPASSLVVVADVLAPVASLFVVAAVLIPKQSELVATTPLVPTFSECDTTRLPQEFLILNVRIEHIIS